MSLNASWLRGVNVEDALFALCCRLNLVVSALWCSQVWVKTKSLRCPINLLRLRRSDTLLSFITPTVPRALSAAAQVSHTHTHTHTHRWRRHSSPHPLCGFLSHFKDVHVLLILKYVIAVRTSPSPELKPALIKLIISCLCSSSQPESLRCKNKAEQSDIQSKIHNSHTAREEFTPPSVDPNH